MSVLVISLEARLQHAGAAPNRAPYELHGAEIHTHIPEWSLVLPVFLAEQLFIGFVLEEDVAKRVQNIINQKAKNLELEVFYSFHYMSEEAVFRMNHFTYDF